MYFAILSTAIAYSDVGYGCPFDETLLNACLKRFPNHLCDIDFRCFLIHFLMFFHRGRCVGEHIVVFVHLSPRLYN
jgi:hypothetical protein